MNLVDEHHLAVAEAELILSVHQDKTPLGSHFRAALKEPQSVLLNLLPHLGVDDSLTDNLLTRDVEVVALVGLCGRSDNGVG